MKRLALWIALVAWTAAAHAAPETYVIDNSQTATQFSYRYLGLSSQTHRFDKISGKVMFDPVARTASAEVTIDATSVNTGHALLDAEIQTADFFDTANYPAITFKSSRMMLDGEQPTMAGELTIKSVTRPVTLAITSFRCTADPVFGIESCGANARLTIKRSDFNMGAHGFLVSNDITLNLAIKAVKAPAYIQVASRDSMR